VHKWGRVERWSRGRHIFVTADPYQLRDAKADDFDGIWRMLSTAFGFDSDDDERDVGRITFEPERSHVITFGDEGAGPGGGMIVGHACAFTRELSVPGTTVPAAHVSLVSVEPTHHRRGLLRRLMTHQLETVHEPIAVLWATEGRIYQRFGYGMASMSTGLSVNVREVALRTPRSAVGTVRASTTAEARRSIQEVYERKRAEQPGLSSRDERWWDAILSDPASMRRGFTAKRYTLFDTGESVDGYAIWRAKSGWNDAGPNGETRILELVAVTPEAYAELWRFLLSIDLARKAIAAPVAVDEPILHLVDEPRQLRATAADGLWVRVVDVPAALAARQYAAPVDVVFEVSDALLPRNAGRWRLRAGADGSAECTPAASEPADLACDVADLGAIYLGGTPLGQLAQAGRIRELRPGALRGAGAAFSWHVAPTAIEIF
jgi:predicted acetyltransferase